MKPEIKPNPMKAFVKVGQIFFPLCLSADFQSPTHQKIAAGIWKNWRYKVCSSSLSRSTKLKKDGNPDLFTGEFWSGAKAKKLGLIDGIGNADEILKEKFGEDVVIKKFEKPKSWINKKLSGANESQIDNLLNILEEKSIWQRYGF